jgi:hypothetical protein
LLFLRAVSDRVHGFHCLLFLVRSLARANMYAHGWYLRYRESLTAKTNTHQLMDCARQIIHEIWRISPIPNLTEILQHDLDLWLWTTIVKIYGPWGHKSA